MHPTQELYAALVSAPPGPSTRELYVRIVNGGVDAVPSAAATAGGAQGAPPADAKAEAAAEIDSEVVGVDAVELDGVADAPKAEPDAKGRKPAQSMTKPTIRSLAQRIASRAAAGGEGGGAAAAAAELFHLLREASFEAKETAWEAEGLGERLVAMVEQGSADACACLGELARSTSAIKRFFSAIGISSRRRKQLEKMGAKKALEGAAKGADAACKAAAKEALKRGFNTLLK